jgi:hypothetical protein
MQLIYPGSDGVFVLFPLLILFVLSLMGFIFMILSCSLKGKKSRLRWLILSIIFLFLPIYNWINYKLEYRKLEMRIAGTYRNSSKDSYIKLKNDGSWKSSMVISGYESGEWKYTISDDHHIVELYDENGVSCSSFHINFSGTGSCIKLRDYGLCRDSHD